MRKVVLMMLLLAAIGYMLSSRPSERLPNEASLPQELVFWGIYDVPDLYQPVINAFEKIHPTIRVVYKQYSDRQEYQKVLLSQLEGHKGPDIFFVDQDSLDQFQPYLVPSTQGGSDDSSSFAPLATQTLRNGQSILALPLWVDSLMMYYNKRYYPEGIKPKWQDFANQTKEISIGGVAMGRVDNIRSGWDILKALLLQKQVKLIGKPEDSLFDTLDFFARFAIPTDRYFNWSESLNKNYPDEEIDSFVRQKVAAIAGYASLEHLFAVKIGQLSAKNIPHIKAEDIGVSLFPQFNTDHPHYLSKYLAIGVSSVSKNPELAWEFIRLLTNRDNAAYYADVSGRTSGRLLPLVDDKNEVKKVQQLQLPNAEAYSISAEIQEKLEQVIEHALKNKNTLRDVLGIQF